MKSLIVAMTVGMAFAGLGETEVLAFYPFKDAAPGTSFTGEGCPVDRITNAVDGALYSGTFTKYGNGDIVFSDERPGKYFFVGNQYQAEESAYCENPGSLYFSGSAGNATDSCQLFFADISTKLSELGTNGIPYIIEFFYKIDPGYTCTWASMFNLYGKWKYSTSTEESSLQILLRDTTKSANCVSFCPSSGLNYPSLTLSDGQCLKDGKWHHVAINWPPAQGDTVSSMIFIPDRDLRTGASAIRAPSRYPNGALTESKPIAFNPDRRFKGWISGLRILQLDKYSAASNDLTQKTLYASDLPTCVPRTMTHLRFDNLKTNATLAAGSVVTNMATTYATANPQLFFNKNATLRYTGDYPGNATLKRIESTGAVSGEVSARTTNLVKKAYVLQGKDKETAQENALSLSLPGAEGYRDATVAYGSGLVIPSGQHGNLYRNYTYEMFFRFDRARYEAQKTAEGTGSGLVSLAWLTYGSVSRVNTWSVALNVTDLEHPKIEFYPDSNVASKTAFVAADALDGKWHHVALRHSNGNFMTCIYDYKTSASCTAGYGTEDICWNRDFCIGSGDGSAAFPGEIDEVRLSWGIVPTDELLRAGDLAGLMLLFR